MTSVAGQDAADKSYPPLSAGAAADLIEHQLDRMAELADSFGVIVADISRWSVGGHVLHLALSGSGMAVSLLTGRTWDGDPKSPEAKEHILKSGRIPRGRAQAPESVQPARESSTEGILAALGKCRMRVSRIPAAPEEAFIVHPYLGRLSRDELLRFLAIHNRHHLDIIESILAAA